MFVVDDIAIAAAAEFTTEVAVEVGTETATELATDMASERIIGAETTIIGDNIGEIPIDSSLDGIETAAEDETEMATEAATELATDMASERITGAETTIIGDNIGEIQDLSPIDSSLDGIRESEGGEMRDLPTNNISNNAVDMANGLDTEVPEGVENSPRTIKTINDGLVGQNHPDTGVPYVEKEVVTDTGEHVKGVFPQFESKVDIQLPEEMEQAPDRTQFAECNKQLAEKISNDPELRTQFTEDQLADINDGYTPEGYTWHHNEEKGKMQLVDSDIHSQTRHTGGRNIWGGGTENRH